MIVISSRVAFIRGTTRCSSMTSNSRRFKGFAPPILWGLTGASAQSEEFRHQLTKGFHLRYDMTFQHDLKNCHFKGRPPFTETQECLRMDLVQKEERFLTSSPKAFIWVTRCSSTITSVFLLTCDSARYRMEAGMSQDETLNDQEVDPFLRGLRRASGQSEEWFVVSSPKAFIWGTT